MQANIAFMDIFAYTGYKYIGLCVGLVALVFGQSFYFFTSLLLAVSLGYFIMKTLASVITHAPSGILPRPAMILLFAGLQSIVFCILSV